MDSLSDILSNKDFAMPDEATAIKSYVAKTYALDVSVTVTANEIIVSSTSAGLISSLRLNSPALQKAANTAKKIRFRIG